MTAIEDSSATAARLHAAHSRRDHTIHRGDRESSRVRGRDRRKTDGGRFRVPREDLLEQVWKLRNAPNTRSVDNFIVRLRKYFEPAPDKPIYFLSHRGAGYKFVPEGRQEE